MSDVATPGHGESSAAAASPSTGKVQREKGHYDRIDGFRVWRRYREELDPTLADNEMALALPMLEDDDDVESILSVFPAERASEFFERPRALRIEYLQTMDEFYVPREFDIDVIFEIVAMVRKAMRGRHPKNPEVMRVILAAAEGKKVAVKRTSETGGGGGLGIVLVGTSGIGKSSLVDRVRALFGYEPHVHLSLNGKACRWKQLTAVVVQVQDTWKGTLLEILAEIDRQTGRGVLRGYNNNTPVTKLVLAVKLALCAQFAPILILDEFQRLGTLTMLAAGTIMAGLIQIMEYGGIPVMVVGTVAVGALFERHNMEMSKFAGAGRFDMPLMNLDDKDTEVLMQMFKEFCVSKTPVTYSDDFNYWFMAHTMGVRRFMRMTMKAVLSRHAKDETVIADKALLESIAAKEMASWQPALSCLRKVDLGFEVPLSEQDSYEHYFWMADRPRPTPAEEALHLEWLQDHLDDEGTLTAEEYLIHKARLSADGLRMADQDEAQAKRTRAAEKKPMKSYEYGKKNQAKRDKKAQQNMDRVVKATKRFEDAAPDAAAEGLKD